MGASLVARSPGDGISSPSGSKKTCTVVQSTRSNAMSSPYTERMSMPLTMFMSIDAELGLFRAVNRLTALPMKLGFRKAWPSPC